MICYRDRTFCSCSDQCQKGDSCTIAITPFTEEQAEKMGLPICFASFENADCFEPKK